MSSAVQQYVRDRFIYASAYLQGRLYALPRGPSELSAWVGSKVMSIVALPLPLLSFLVVPFYGGSSTTVSLVVFYLTWSALVLSHDPLTIEIYGTLVIRLVCFVLPAVVFLLFDAFYPRLSRNVKAYGLAGHHPGKLQRRRVLEVAGVAIGNIILGVLFQAALEFVVTRVFHMRSIIKVTTILPLPWTIFTSILKGLACRGLANYFIHRFLLHTYNTVLKKWHAEWQHSVNLPFSMVAAYDHPVNYLLRDWLPAFLPAYLFRWHVLTWHLFVIVVSVEELFVYSGYSVLPSSIILAGMARRTDAHFDTVRARGSAGNFGHLGLIDFVLGTTCRNEDDFFDDIRSEAAKHGLQERIESAVQAALDKEHEGSETAEAKAKSKTTRKRKTAGRQKSDDDAADAKREPLEDDQGKEPAAASKRRSKRDLFKLS